MHLGCILATGCILESSNFYMCFIIAILLDAYQVTKWLFRAVKSTLTLIRKKRINCYLIEPRGSNWD